MKDTPREWKELKHKIITVLLELEKVEEERKNKKKMAKKEVDERGWGW